MTSITLEQAKTVVAAAEEKADEIGVAINIAVVDAGNNLTAFVRQNGAWLGSIEIAKDKAFTARAFDIFLDRGVGRRGTARGSAVWHRRVQRGARHCLPRVNPTQARTRDRRSDRRQRRRGRSRPRGRGGRRGRARGGGSLTQR